MKTFKQELRERDFRQELESLGLSVDDFAKHAYSSPHTVSHWYYKRRRTPGIAFSLLDRIILDTKNPKQT